MPREERMFGDVVDPSVRVSSRQGTSILITVVLETAMVGALIVVPLMAVDVLPTPNEAIEAFVMRAPAPEPPPQPRATPPAGTRRPQSNLDAAPLEPPPGLTPEPPVSVGNLVPPDAGVAGFVPDGAFGGLEDGRVIAPPPPAAPPASVRVGGTVRRPEKTKHVAPIYPAIARSAHVEGTVIIEAAIDQDGRVSGARVLRGHPLLDGEALAAVRQWTFTPTLLNGVPTPVVMSVTVNFRLQ